MLRDPAGLNAEIRAFAIGNVNPVYLDRLDDGVQNDSVRIVTDPSALQTELVDGGGVDAASVLSVELSVNGGTPITLGSGDLTLTPFGLSFSRDLTLDLVADDVIEAVVAFDQDADGVADSFISVSQTVESDDQAPVVTFGTIFQIEENESYVGKFSAFDPEGNALSYSIVGGDDASDFYLTGPGELSFFGLPDYENPADFDGDNVYHLTVDVDDGVSVRTQDVEVRVADLDDNAPPTVALVPLVSGITENTELTAPLAVASILVSDDAQTGPGGNVLGLTGEDADLFEILGSQLFLKAGVELDAETMPTLDVSATVDDASTGGTPDDAAVFSLPVVDVNEIIEFGNARVNHDAVTIDLVNTYEDPVVVAFVTTERGTAPVAVRVVSTGSDQISLQLQEPGYLDGRHPPETVRYIVAEKGAWELPGGLSFQAGTLDTGNVFPLDGMEDVTFKNELFDDIPAVFSQVQTLRGADWVFARQTGATSEGFSVAMQEAESKTDGHIWETIGWMAFEQGVFELAGQTIEIGLTPRRVGDAETGIDFTHDFEEAPNVMAQLTSVVGVDPAQARLTGVDADGFDVYAQEEKSADPELGHRTEQLSYIAMEEDTALPGEEIPLDPPTAVDDVLGGSGDCVEETEGAGDIDGNVLPNDLNPDGFPLTIVEVGDGHGVGEWVEGSNGGRFWINADGTFDFDAEGDFTYLREGESATTSVTYDLGFEGPAERFDLVLLQDLSGSFSDDLANVQTQIPEVANYLATYYDAAFGVASFVDKPIGGFGSGSDYVYQTEMGVTDSLSDLSAAVSGLRTFYGGDGPEAQLEALLQLAVRAEGEVGYRDGAQRFVVLSTDATYHVEGDYNSAPANDGDDQVEDEDYPNIDQVRDALEDADITPIFLVTDGTATIYEGFVSQLGFGEVVELTSDSSNLASAIEDALDTVEGRSRATVEIEICGEDNPPVFSEIREFTVKENSTFAGRVFADSEGHGDVSYSIVGGADMRRLSIDAETGVMSFNRAVDFEAPYDSEPNNEYRVWVRAENDVAAVSKLFVINVADTNERPFMLSPDHVSVTDGVSSVAYLQGYDPDAGDVLRFDLTGNGADDGLFEVSPVLGQIVKSDAFDMSLADDEDGDFEYEIEVRVTDADGLFDTQMITIGYDSLA